MNTLTKILLPISICVFVVGLYLLKSEGPEPLGSIDNGSGAYMSTTTRSAVAGVALPSPTRLALGIGVLGSVVITGAGAGVINIYDATSTYSYPGGPATTTLATFPASTAAGTYVFDVVYNKGLIIEITGAPATSTITWKYN